MKPIGKAALAWYANKARASNYPVSGGRNGGGWIRLAGSIGVHGCTKNQARNALQRRFGLPRASRVAFPKAQPRHVFAKTYSFLESYEWRRVRMQALKKYGARCQCCGASPADGIKINVDHIKPRKIFPQLALELDNLQVLCEVCNHGKGNWDMTDWREPTKILDEAQAQHFADIIHD